jgi:hypothetical protein
MVLNGFNQVPIHKGAWRAGIQPKVRVAMAILVEAATIQKGKCADPSCPGQVGFEKSQVSRIWQVNRFMNKHGSSQAEYLLEIPVQYVENTSRPSRTRLPRPRFIAARQRSRLTLGAISRCRYQKKHSVKFQARM